MKRIRISLLGKVVIAIAAGILFGQFLPSGIARIFVTFNSLFGEFLSFSIPLIIVGLVVPAIGDLGKGAGRLLLLTALIAYGSTIFSGFFTFFNNLWWCNLHFISDKLRRQRGKFIYNYHRRISHKNYLSSDNH